MRFKDTDKTVFVGRRVDGTIYGVWANRQWPEQEEILHDDPRVVEFLNAPPRLAGEPKPTAAIIDPRIVDVEADKLP